MISRTKIAEATRVRDNQGNTVYFTIPGGTGRRVVTFIDRERMLPFEGDRAWFEFEFVIAKPWSYWQPVRQVDLPVF